MIVAINYADEKFEKNRKENSRTAYKKGKADKVIEYSYADLDKEFTTKHAKILSYKRGAGLWLWKPYIILKTLNQMQNGDYLFYCDSGAYYVNEIQNLIDVLDKSGQDIMPFVCSLLERQFTKKEAFEIMGFDKYDLNQIITTCILIKKNDKSVAFIQEWQDYMYDERLSSYEHFCPEIEEFTDFVSHREDQSIFSLLCYKKELKVYRDPSNYGERPWMYVRPGTLYQEPVVENSPYPKIIISCRKMPASKYRIKEFFMHYLWKMGIFNQKVCYKMHGISTDSLK
jgi:hypothetical protein